MTESLRAGDDAAKAVQKTPNHVTLDYIESRIKSVEYINPKGAPHMTIAVVYYDNGYIFMGKAAFADPENFDAELGKKFAREDAVRSIWPVEGFALRERLAK